MQLMLYWGNRFIKGLVSITKQNALSIKLTVFIMMTLFLQVSAKTFSQQVTFSGRNVSLEKIFTVIEEQTGYVVFYNYGLIKTGKPVSVNVKSVSLEEFLNACFHDQHLTYVIEGKTILVTRKEGSTPGVGPLTVNNTIIVSGRVTNMKGEALAGVSIKIKGTDKGTTTDEKGWFRIEIPDNASKVLVISFVGMQTQEVPVNNKMELTIQLRNADSQQQEVIIVGYGSQKKSDITGSVASVKLKELTQLPARRVDQALQGRVSGLMVQNDNASPNAPVTIRIRGVNSVNGGNDPLVVIDGLQLGTLSSLNPNDVESVEVLKDASATAIYGARGANGVIIVTTKKGKKGKPVVTYNAYFSFSRVLKKLDQLNAEQYAIAVNENRKEFGAGEIFSADDLETFKTQSTNWQDVIFRKGFAHDHQVSVSGSSDNTSYAISATATGQNGIIIGSSFSGYAIRSNIRTQVSKQISVGLNLFANRNVSHPTVINTYAGANAASPVYSALQFAPVKPVYEADGSYSKPGGGYGPPTSFNPLALAIEPVVDNITNDVNAVADVEYKITEQLKVDILGGYKGTNGENNAYFNSKPSGSPGTEAASISNYRLMLLQNTNMVTYENRFGDHTLKLTGVVEQQYVKNNGSSAGSIGFLTNAVTYYNLSLGNNPQIPQSYGNASSLLSYMGRLNYNYSDRYSLTVTGRYDGSSVFGASNKWGFFPSVGAAWNITNEHFMSSVRGAVSGLKLRASYGVVGNQAISPYQSLASLNNNLLYILNGSSASVGVGLGRTGNPDLKWEKTAQFNIGIDADFLDGRINLVADYYDKKTTDLLFSVKLPAIGGGAGSILRNVGSMQNSGFEFYLGGKPFVDNFKWETGLTLSLNKNKLLELYNGLNELPLGDPGVPGFGNTIWLEVGKPVGVFRGYVMNGVWKTAEAASAAVYGAVPGYPKYVDQNKDNKINGADIVDIGNSQPRFVFGWTNTFGFKNFDLNFFFQGVQGNKIYNVSRVRFERTTTDADATSVKILDRWTPTHEDTDVPSFKGTVVYEQNQSTRWLEDGSYVRLKTLTLGYTFSNFKTNILSSARIYAGSINLFTKTKYSGFEPEARTGVDSRSGVDIATYPSQKSFTIGLNVKF
ncbi:MAG: TonB-dependent receptor [Chitinophagaceae bacterium]|nr:TonB-dependent receptor [Chitinophagaceae bacterium]